MAANHSEFAIGQDGSITRAGNNSDGYMETNVSVFVPSNPTAFDNARDATCYTRLGTRHSAQELKAALEASPDLDNTFCLSVNNVVLVFSASAEEHTAHCPLPEGSSDAAGSFDDRGYP
ncbi:hypothetical protein BFW01_g942 [Lasiodiplodia theobromae]|uniref:Uncharacterized protein n=1 Tax=Lasiodiplodia theobromae TaxID=45133 RepID=A0A5N5D4J9_9PEZI|nr:hypothetical protein DBV05_g8694 [Lasiodiplodia theobromae]KAF9630380.1 hypothetical protein BFW01_g942 [Lasiodiplodia theobromae]